MEPKTASSFQPGIIYQNDKGQKFTKIKEGVFIKMIQYQVPYFQNKDLVYVNTNTGYVFHQKRGHTNNTRYAPGLYMETQ